MFYFAHGSNIDLPQMKVCCPGAEFVIAARLNGYRLCFPRWSKVRNSAVAGIAEAKGEIVWGALYEVGPSDLRRLDLIEGSSAGRDAAQNTANRITVRVERPDGITAEAETHVAVAMAEPGRPSAGYLMVLARAAKALEFPEDYIAKLQAAEVAPLAA